ncbi:protein translocase subunit SecD [Actinotalea fermentans]|uniref:Protein translocase subunit SecD n=1 Tax=Actinotalea fermentans TaxID=43671 RepID=A0A511YUF4_9CELL|nr:protein translocase subunit SecD [Actinotalea fermentans]KGM17310.1 protein-export membrane protein SecD [Actinotalea fermentans ATCC 43279 = JCM 9966 = DSM 3133]GEN78825.1 protein translocase subunit SecD [Actinotalea fermentans]
MATTTRRERPVRPLVTLALLVIGLVAALVAGERWSDASLTPQLALDLEGGTEVILRPVATTGEDVTDAAIAQAIDIIRQRVDASGVAEAEITSQGGSNIVVGLPGTPSEETLRLVKESAQLVFRPVLVVANPEPYDPTAVADPTVPTDDAAVGDGATDEGATGTEDGAGTADQVSKAATGEGDGGSGDSGSGDSATPANPSDLSWLTADLTTQLNELDCTDPANLVGGASRVGDPNAGFVTCAVDGTAKYALGPVEITGDLVSSASSGLRVTAQGAITNERVVNLEFNSEGTRIFADTTERLLSLEAPRNQFAIVLDGLVISAPQVNSVIPDGGAEISGNFTTAAANTLARQLNFGSLPLTFEVQSEEQISATLGDEQLQRGLLAGLIGLILVGLYSLGQYRALGFVTIASLVVAGALAFLTITVLSWVQGYRLSLPGVAGLIVAIGITADSFIVYFERIKDELREGRPLAAAVDAGWSRAKRTILASDAVSLLAAVVLYFLAVGGVRGFAFTLGLTTVIDLIIVFLFTHPVMLLLSRRRFFAEGHRFSGLDPSLLGARSRYVGRGKVREPEPAAGAPQPVAAGVGDWMTIAERKAAQRAAAGEHAQAEGKDA